MSSIAGTPCCYTLKKISRSRAKMKFFTVANSTTVSFISEHYLWEISDIIQRFKGLDYFEIVKSLLHFKCPNFQVQIFTLTNPTSVINSLH